MASLQKSENLAELVSLEPIQSLPLGGWDEARAPETREDPTVSHSHHLRPGQGRPLSRALVHPTVGDGFSQRPRGQCRLAALSLADTSLLLRDNLFSSAMALSVFLCRKNNPKLVL